jgi:hypothetical protein
MTSVEGEEGDMLRGAFTIGGIGLGRRRRGAVVAAATALAVLALVPAASASGWALQSVQTQNSWLASQLNGVSCAAANDCYGVGFSKVVANQTSQTSALIEHWNGTAWSIWNSGGPTGTNFSELTSVSCLSSTFCIAVGEYDSGGNTLPLAYTWSGGAGLTQQNAPLSPAATGSFASVSCQSSSFCEAVGTTLPANAVSRVPLVEEWNGSAMMQQASGPSSGDASLRAVSCAVAQSGFCMAVGIENLGGSPTETIVPYVEALNGSGWVTQTKTSDDRFVVQPAGTSAVVLSGVQCEDASDCQLVGNYYTSTGGQVVSVWGAKLASGSWTLESLPPANGSAGFGLGDDLACPGSSDCWAVGNYANGGSLQLFADNLNAGQWGFATLPNPPGTEPALGAVDCPQINYCEAVGSYRNSAGSSVAFAEQYYYSVPNIGPPHKCIDPDCPPPQPGIPHRLALSVERHGAM